MLCLIKSQKKSEKIMNEFEIINNYFRKLATSKASLNLNDDIFFDKKNFNLIGWQTLDIYQNLNITYLFSIEKNQKIDKNLFKIPPRE